MRHLSVRFYLSSAVLLGLGLTGCGTRVKEEMPPVVTAPVAVHAPAPVIVPPKEAPKEYGLRLGLLLPLSGPHGAVGQDLLKAAQMALFDRGRDDILLVPQDSGGSVESAHRATQKLLDQQVDLILGPLLAPEVGGVKELTRSRAKTLIAFTSDKSVVGDGIYSLGFAPDQQVQRIVRYAKSQGFGSIVVLLPEGAYGRLVAEALAPLKGEVNFKKIIYYTNTSQVQASNLDLAAGDALLVVEGGEALKALTQTLRAQGVDPGAVQFLGTAQWDHPATFANGDVTRGWFAAPDDKEWQNFSSRFEALYGHTPNRLASLAYDGVALAASLGEKSPGERASLLLNSEGFVGLDGAFTFNESGMAQRPLEIFEVTPGGMRRRGY